MKVLITPQLFAGNAVITRMCIAQSIHRLGEQVLQNTSLQLVVTVRIGFIADVMDGTNLYLDSSL